MSVNLAIWVALWPVMLAALKAFKDTSREPFLFRCGPAHMAMSCFSLLMSRFLELTGNQLSLVQFPIRPYIIVWLLLSVAATVVSLCVLRMRAKHDHDEHEQGGIG